MKIVIDMNLTPQWCAVLEKSGHQAVHWSDVGEEDALDQTIMQWAREHDHIVFTHDLDFSALLAAANAEGPSVLQVRTQDVLPGSLASTIISALAQFKEALNRGAILTIDASRVRVRILPLQR